MSTITEGDERSTALLGAERHGCEATLPFLGMEWVCGEPAADRYRRACVHEHIREGWLCHPHANWPGGGLCRTCCDLPGDLSHECPINLAEVTG